MIHTTADRIAVTHKGRLLADTVIAALMAVVGDTALDAATSFRLMRRPA